MFMAEGDLKKQAQNMLSVIVTVFNEQETIGPLFDQINNALEPYSGLKEIIFVDDVSVDNSWKIINQLAEKDKCVRIFRQPFNRGQHKAIEKGFQEARGEIVVTLDGDLQNDPADIPKLIEKLNEGFDLVCGWRSCRKDPWNKKIKSWIANLVQRKITGIAVHDMACALRVYRGSLIKKLALQNRYEAGLIPYILSRYTNRITEVKVDHHRRRFGKSNYGFLATSVGTIYSYIRLMLRNKREYILTGGQP